METRWVWHSASRPAWGLSILLLLLPLGGSRPIRAQTVEEPESRASSARAEKLPDTRGLAKVLHQHVKSAGVDYAALKADAASVRRLQAFLQASADMPETASLAHWLNVYNARVLQLVVEHYPLDSVRAVPGFFDRRTLVVAKTPRTLDALENEVIRARFEDARVHVALHCAAVSCPPLSPTPFTPETLDATLDRLARATVASPRHVRLAHGVLHHSKIFEWFEADFVRDAGSVLAWIKRYSKDPAIRALPKDTPGVAVPYDWALADAP